MEIVNKTGAFLQIMRTKNLKYSCQLIEKARKKNSYALPFASYLTSAANRVILTLQKMVTPYPSRNMMGNIIVMIGDTAACKFATNKFVGGTYVSATQEISACRIFLALEMGVSIQFKISIVARMWNTGEKKTFSTIPFVIHDEPLDSENAN